MIEEITLEEFLRFLSVATGDQAIDIIHRFQRGGLIIEGMGIEDFEEEDNAE